jgi:hypothetical protein
VSSRRRILKKRLMRLFPHLRASNFRITSKATNYYNCIAWAVGKSDEWWEYRRGYTWPQATRTESVASAIELFEAQRFEKCASAAPEVGWNKIAIYGDNSGYTHAAKQLANGHWSSKLGKLHDIEHKTLEDLVEGDYGEVKQVMRKGIAKGR